MRIFVLGGTGYIGSQVVRALVARGDEVRTLTRSEESAKKARRLGAEPVRGDLADADLLRSETDGADAAIHLAALDEQSARAGAEGLRGARRYVHTGSIWSFGNTHGGADDSQELHPPEVGAFRTEIEDDVLSHGGVVLMPAVVYGEGGGLLPLVFGDGRYVGSGEYHVALIHLEDAASAYVHALDAEPGTRMSAVGQCVEARLIAEAMHDPPASETLRESEERLGAGLAGAMALDQRITSVRLRDLGWAPRHRDALADLRG